MDQAQVEALAEAPWEDARVTLDPDLVVSGDGTGDQDSSGSTSAGVENSNPS